MALTKFQRYFCKVAKDTSELSYASRRKVGAVLVADEQRIVCVGYNGTPRGESNECEEFIDGKLVTKKSVRHAEENLFRFANQYNILTYGLDLYLTCEPCERCARIIWTQGIKKVFYFEKYESSMPTGLQHLDELGIEHEFLVL